MSEQQQMDSQNNFSIQSQKLISSDVVSAYWSHNMFIVVIITDDNLLQLYRVFGKAQRIFQVSQKTAITALTFTPDSQYVAYGMEDGQIKVLKTQNGQTLLTVTDPINQKINSFSFVQFGKYSISKIFPFKRSQIMQKLILQISPHKQCNKASIVKLNYFNQLTDQSMFTLLASSSQNHISLYLNGFITIATVNCQLMAVKHFNGNQYKIQFSHFSKTTDKLQSVILQQTMECFNLYLVQFKSSILKDMKPDIVKFNCLLGYVSQIIDFIEKAYPTAQKILRDLLRQYNQKMNLIDDPEQQNINPCNQLFKYLNCGIASQPFHNFLTKQIYDNKSLQKLDQTINAFFNNLHDLLLESIQNSLERAYLLIQQLKALCQLQKYKIFGIKKKQMEIIQEKIGKLYTMGEIILVQSTQAKFDIRNLLVWLNKAAIKTASDPNTQTQNTKCHLSRYTVDFTRLHSFLQTQQRFRLQNLLSFFTKTQQTHTMRIPQCEFRLLNRLNKKNKKQTQAFIQQTKKIQKLLDLQDIKLQNYQKMSLQVSYKSFKIQHQQLKHEWKQLKVKPIIQISKSIEKDYQITKVSQITSIPQMPQNLKCVVKKNYQTNQNQLLLYWIQYSLKGQDKLVQFNTQTKTRRFIILPPAYQPLSFSIGAQAVLLIDNPQSEHEQKAIVEIMNQEWNGQQLEVGKRMDNLSGEVLINAGMRGSTLMVQNKNRLVVFS